MEGPPPAAPSGALTLAQVQGMVEELAANAVAVVADEDRDFVLWVKDLLDGGEPVRVEHGQRIVKIFQRYQSEMGYGG